jgi:hypothetical protein
MHDSLVNIIFASIKACYPSRVHPLQFLSERQKLHSKMQIKKEYNARAASPNKRYIASSISWQYN